MGADVNASFSLLKDSNCSVVHLNGGKLCARGGSLTHACFLVIAIGRIKSCNGLAHLENWGINLL